MSYRRWVLVAVILFGIGLVVGLTTPAGITSLLSGEISALRELAGFIVPFSFLTFILIFIKNVSSLLISFVLSPVLCLIPVLSLVINGWIIAFVSTLAAREESLGFVFAGLAPHGIFELPAFIMGQAAALSFGAAAILAFVEKEKRNLLLSILRQDFRHLLLALILFLFFGLFHAIIIVALLKRESRDLVLPNLNQSLKYFLIAIVLLLPAAIIETYITPLLLT